MILHVINSGTGDILKEIGSLTMVAMEIEKKKHYLSHCSNSSKEDKHFIKNMNLWNKKNWNTIDKIVFTG